MSESANNHDLVILQELAWVRELARRLLGDDSQVDDVVHDAWVAARLQPRSAIRTNFRSWLATVVHNRVRRIIRTERRRTRREQTVARAPIVDSTIDIVERGALVRELTAAVMALDEPYRSAILLRYLDGLRGEQIAARQGVSHDAARKRISRGLQMLRERLGKGHGGFAAWGAPWSAYFDRIDAPAANATSSAVGASLRWTIVPAVAAAVTLAVGAWWVLAAGPEPAAPRGAAGVAAKVEQEAPPDIRQPLLAERSPALPDAIVVEDDSGAPRPGVTLLCLSHGALLKRAVTDDDGRSPVPPAGTDEVLLAAPGAAARCVPWIEGPAPSRIVFPGGARVAGWVQIPPGQTTRLALLHDRVADWAGRVGPEVLTELECLGITPDRIVVPLNDTTRFCIGGLPTTWSGRLMLGDGWTLRGPRGVERAGLGSSLLLLAPLDDLRLEATPPLLAVGRLTQAGQPAPGLTVRALWRSSFGPAPSSCRSDEHGAFALGIGRAIGECPTEVRLFVDGPGGGALIERRFAVAAGGERIDLGELSLGPSLVVRVFDPAGRPIAGASVSTPTGLGTCPRAETDVAGSAVVPYLPAGAEQVSVRARGYRATMRPIDGATELHVTLAPGNGLDIACRVRGGTATRGLSLQIDAHAVPFVTATEGPARTIPGQPFRQLLQLDDSGRAELSDLVPGSVLMLTVVDALGRAVARAEVTAPPPPRIDTVTLEAANLHAIDGCVRTQNGRAIPGAGIQVEVDGHVARTVTDADGRFTLGAAIDAPARARLVVDHPAFAHFVDEAVIGTTGLPLAIVLQPAHVLRVRLVRPDGQPVDGCWVETAGNGSGHLIAVERERGMHVFDRLPFRAGTVTALIGGHRFTVGFDATQDEIEMHVPPLGELSLTVASPDAPAGAHVLLRVTDVDLPAHEQCYPLEHSPGEDLARRRISLLPGLYRVQLERPRGSAGIETLGDAMTVRVRAGEILELTPTCGQVGR